jgi:hypothetical protein
VPEVFEIVGAVTVGGVQLITSPSQAMHDKRILSGIDLLDNKGTQSALTLVTLSLQ